MFTFIQKRTPLALVILIVGFTILSFDKTSFGKSVIPGESWQKASYSQMKYWSNSKLRNAKDYWKSLGSTSVMIVENGFVVAEWGYSKRPIHCHSVRKSFVSGLYGILFNKWDIKMSDTLARLGIDDSPDQLSVSEKQATVRDLLMSKSGVYHPAAYETKKMREKRPKRGSHKPGTFFYYNNWDFNALGTIFEKKSGLNVFKAFQQYIASPIGMQDLGSNDMKFVYDDITIHPAYTFKMSTRDRARFGLLYLYRGKWGSRQIIPSKWISQSTRAYTKVGPGVGYGYMWWVSMDGWHFGSKFRGRPYSARGNFGQYIVVIPEKRLVVVQSVDHSDGDKIDENKSFNELLKLILAAKIEGVR
jgi:CubicO group peptidase (beta-lactamase class C family)